MSRPTVATLGTDTRIDPVIEAQIARLGWVARWTGALYALLLLLAVAAGWHAFLMPSRFTLGGGVSSATAWSLVALTSGILLAGDFRGSNSGPILLRRTGVALGTGAALTGVIFLILRNEGTTAELPALGLAFGLVLLGLATTASVSRLPGLVMAGQTASLLTMGLAAVLVLGYLSGDASFGRLFVEIEISFHSATTMLLSSLGVFLLRPGSGMLAPASSPGLGGRVLRRVGPLVLLAPALLMLIAETVSVTQRVETLAVIAITSGFVLVTLLGVAVYVLDHYVVEASTAISQAERAREGLQQEAPVAANLSNALHQSASEPIPGWDIATMYRPATGTVAGDSSGVVVLPGDRLAAVLVDVTGHGAEPTITAVKLRDLLVHSLSLDQGPAAALASVAWARTPEILASAIVMIVDLSTGSMRIANAGHPPAILIGTQRTDLIGPTGPLLFLTENVSYTEHEEDLAIGDSIVLFSDGIADIQAMRGERNEIEFLADMLLAEGGDAGRGAHLVLGFAERDPTDDQSVIVMLRSGTFPRHSSDTAG